MTCALAIVGAVAACGGSGQAAPIAHVGAQVIGATALTQEIVAIAPGHVVPEPPNYKRCVRQLQEASPLSTGAAGREECAAQYQELKRRALGLLISSEWLVGEAKERRLSVSGSTLTAEARSAEAQLRHLLASQEAPITKAVVAAYYRQHITRYERPEQRDIGIVERIATKAAAQRALERVARAKDMTRVAIPESFVKTNLAEVVPRKRAIIKAIFAGKPHTLIGPLPLNEKWCFFEVTSVVPRDVQSLAQLQAAIARRLAAEQQQRTLTDFIAAWRKKWTARTRCSRGYVVQKCSQYRGVEAAEDATAFD